MYISKYAREEKTDTFKREKVAGVDFIPNPRKPSVHCIEKAFDIAKRTEQLMTSN